MVINALYVMDIFMNMRTTYYDYDGKEITNGWDILWNYIKTALVPDLLTSIPFEEIIPVKGNNKKLLKMISVLKGTRIKKFKDVIYRLDIKDETKALYNMLLMSTYFIIYIHCTACLFYYIISLDESWVPINDLSQGKTDLWVSGQVYQYFTSLYYMVLVIGGNETVPTTVGLKFFSAAAILIGNLYIANIMGSMANLVSIIQRRDNTFDYKLDIANSIMSGINISGSTQSEVRSFFYQNRISSEAQKEIIQFMSLISPSLK